MRKTLSLLSSLAALVLFAPGTARAQFIESTVQANVPFEFTVGRRTLPAGDYTFVAVAPALLLVRDRDCRTVASVLTNPVQTTSNYSLPRLRFYLQDGKHVLAEVWQPGGHTGYEVSRKPSERELRIAAGTGPGSNQ
jgi:hypothetical protein